MGSRRGLEEGDLENRKENMLGTPIPLPPNHYCYYISLSKWGKSPGSLRTTLLFFFFSQGRTTPVWEQWVGESASCDDTGGLSLLISPNLSFTESPHECQSTDSRNKMHSQILKSYKKNQKDNTNKCRMTKGIKRRKKSLQKRLKNSPNKSENPRQT